MSYFNKTLDSIIPVIETNYGILKLPNTVIDSVEKKITVTIPFKKPWEIPYKKLGKKYLVDSNVSKDIESVNIKNLLLGLAPIKHVGHHGSLSMDKVVENCLLHTFIGASKSYSLEKFMAVFTEYDITSSNRFINHFGIKNIDYEDLKESLKMHSYLYHLANDIDQDQFYSLMYMLYNKKLYFGIDRTFFIKSQGLTFSANNPYIDLAMQKTDHSFNVDLGYRYKLTLSYGNVSNSQFYDLNNIINDKARMLRILNDILTGIIKKDIGKIKIHSFSLLEEVVTDTPIQICISNLLSKLYPDQTSVINSLLETDTYQWYHAAYELLNPGLKKEQALLKFDFIEP